MVLLPALAQLRQAKTGADALWEIDALPDQLLPEVAAEMAARESLFEPAVIRTVLQCVGFDRLADHVGVARATAIVARHCVSKSQKATAAPQFHGKATINPKATINLRR